MRFLFLILFCLSAQALEPLLKSDVHVAGMRPELVPALLAADRIYRANGAFMTVTSVSEGEHKEKSLHPEGLAFDLRTRNFTRVEVDRIARAIRESLTIDYDVVVEKTHIHVEFQPKR